jgi:hypothetical protein
MEQSLKNPEEQVGRKTKFVLTRPEFVFFVDEVGCNTSQKMMGMLVAKSLLYKVISELRYGRPSKIVISLCWASLMRKVSLSAVLLFWQVQKSLLNTSWVSNHGLKSVVILW